ncbi:hypothetical protein ACQCSV_13570 [Pseudarthrobacter sp. S3]|uniref:hypothetical protein n=1 Tax=Pseudarthrobacter sp. S3 TaxID=3418419 RepID=UPI003CF6C91C
MSTGGNLFGTRVIWMRIVAIAVIFVLWMQINSCNAAADSKKESARLASLATSDGAIGYCKESVRFSDGHRERFAITAATATRRTTPTKYDVVVKYEYFDSYRKVMHPESRTCAVGYGGFSGGWYLLRQ